MFKELEIEELLLFEEDDDYVLEANINGIESDISTMFQHLLKYQYQPQRQDKSWLDSINKTYINIMKNKDINKRNTINRINLDKCYKDGRREALKETKLPHNVIPEQRPYNWDMNFVTDINLIIEFLRTYYNPNATYNIDLDEYIETKLRKI